VADHPNAAHYRAIFDAMNTGDMEVADAALADDVVWHVIGSDDPIVGKEAVLASFAGMDEAGIDFSGELHDVVANDEHTIALVTARVTRDGETFEYRTTEILHVADGKVTERWAFSDDTEAINRFFS
jgi:ketosteroid isomerase-like protein